MKKPIRFVLNGAPVETDQSPGIVLLDYLRRVEQRVEVKEGCREGDCGACTVMLGELEDGIVVHRAVTSCLMVLGQVHGKHLVTLESFNRPRGLNPVQRLFLEEGATQCGFCTGGILVSLGACFLAEPEITERGALTAIAGNLCRCTGYASVIRAVRRACAELAGPLNAAPDRLRAMIDAELLPEVFAGVPAELERIAADEGGYAPRTEPGRAPLIAGGTDLLVRHVNHPDEPEPALVLRDRPGDPIRRENGWLYLPASTTFEELGRSAEFLELVPRAPLHLELVASRPIRERATIGGNIANASPAADGSVMLLALDAELGLAGGGKQRTLALKDFHQRYKETELRANELIEWVRVPTSARLFHFEKVSRRTYLDVASVNSAVAVELEGNRLKHVTLAAGGLAPIPLVLQRASRRLEGEEIAARTIAAAARIADEEVAPISDQRGSASYKRLLLRQLIFAHFITLFPGRGLEELSC